MELSKRLQAVADLLSGDLKVADIGCDHGFLSIYLIEHGKAPWCLAMDVNEGPLCRAREHIRDRGLSTYIETRLSDGAKEIRFLCEETGRQKPETEAAVLAGMGGRLMMKIIAESLDKFVAMEEFILQPQSEISQLRAYIRSIGHQIVEEDMVLEDGKFYPIMKIKKGSETEASREERKLFDRYGELLLRKKHPVLLQFLEREKELYGQILEGLAGQTTEKSKLRRQEIEEILAGTKQGLDWFKG